MRNTKINLLALLLLLPSCATLAKHLGPESGSRSRFIIASVGCVHHDPRLSAVYGDLPGTVNWLSQKLRTMAGVASQIRAGNFSLTEEQAAGYLDTMDVMERVRTCLRAGRVGGDAGVRNMEDVDS